MSEYLSETLADTSDLHTIGDWLRWSYSRFN